MMFTKLFLDKVCESIRLIDLSELEKMIDILVSVRKTGRLFIIGSGGGAGHASHAACDFRKICNIEAYAPYDNVSELTARTNDEGYNTSIIEWLKVSNFRSPDCILVISVGGGAPGVSENITRALVFANLIGAKIIGITGPDGGKTRELANACITIQSKNYVTPVIEGIQAVIWHCIVTHPKLQINKTKW